MRLSRLLVVLLVALSLSWPALAAPTPAPTAPGLDITTPTTHEEAISGLMNRPRYGLTSLLLRIGVYNTSLDFIKTLANQLRDLPGLITLQCRVVSILEVLGAHTDAVTLGEKMLTFQKPGTYPESELLMHLALMQAARQAARPVTERQHIEAARRLIANMHSPLSSLAQFIIMSLEFDSRLRGGPELDSKSYEPQHRAAWTLLRSVPHDCHLSPFVMTWTGKAARIWLVQDIKLAFHAEQSGLDAKPMTATFTDDIDFLVVLLQERLDIELVDQLAEAIIDAAHQAALAKDYPNALTMLDTVEHLVDTFDSKFKGSGIEKAIADGDTSLARTRVRLWHARAVVMLAQDSVQHGPAAIALLERASAAAVRGSDDVQRVKIEADLVGALIETQPAGWARKAHERVELTLTLARHLDYRPGIIRALTARGILLSVEGDRAGAIRDLSEAVGDIEQYITELGPLDAGRARQSWTDVYERLARLQVEAGQGQAALGTLDRAQRQQNLGLMTPTGVRDPQLRASLQRVEEKRDQNRALEDELTQQKARGQSSAHLASLLASSKQQFFAELGNIRAHDPDYERLLAVRPVNFAAIQDSIPDDTVLVQLFPSAERLYLFVITSKNFKIVSLDVKREEIEARIRDFRGTLSTFSPRTDGDANRDAVLKSTLSTLYGWLVAPIEEDIRSKKVVAFVPTGTLFYLPFQALAQVDASGHLHYLIEQKQVAVLTKASDIAQIREKPTSPHGRLVAFGNPDGSLGGAGEEARLIAGIFPGSQMYLGPEATAQHLTDMQGQIAYLHLATHGVLDSRDQNASYVLFARDTHVHVSEIFGLPLHGTRLVTLSACQTALAGVNPGSELSSLAEAFSIAGSPTVVASLWRVADRSTRDLMVDFYTNLQKGEPCALALQHAELDLLHHPETSHPFYWAPFIVLGDWR